MSSDSKLFTLRPKNGIHVGHSNEGLPLFAALRGNNMLVVHFNELGNMIHFQEHPPLQIAADRSDEEGLMLALQQLGFASLEPIQVRKFFIPQYLVGIRQYPNHLQQFLEEGTEYSTEEIEALRLLRQQLTAERSHDAFSCFDPEEDGMFEDEEDEREVRQFFEEWTEKGHFVLYCGNDFWCNVHGQIIAT